MDTMSATPGKSLHWRALVDAGLAGLTLFGLWTVLAPVTALAKSLPADAATLKRGAQVYSQQCATCHGFKGKGEGPLARSYNPPPTDFTRGEFRHGGDNDDALIKTIQIGVPGTGMTGYKGKLSDADIAAVAAYIRSLKK